MPRKVHLCPWPSCHVMVGPSMWGCSSHWFRLPFGHQRAITQAYERGEAGALLKAIRSAATWAAKHHNKEKGDGEGNGVEQAGDAGPADRDG